MLSQHSGLFLRTMLGYKEIYPDRNVSVLHSFGRPSPDNHAYCTKYRNLINSLSLDCGTFTKNNSKNSDINITLKAYIGFLKVVEKYYDFYFNFDEDFSVNGWTTNIPIQLEIEKAGFSPVPVVHDCHGSEPDYYIDKGHKMVAIGSGGLAKAQAEELYPMMDKFYRAGVKVHFLGAVKYKLIAFLPVWSCDSSTWNQTPGRGYVLYWNPNKRDIDKTDRIYLEDNYPFQKGKMYFMSYPHRTEFETYIDKELGLTYGDLMGPDWLLNRELVNLHYFCELERLVTNKHRELGFQFD